MRFHHLECRRAVAPFHRAALFEIRESAKLHPIFWNFFSRKSVLASWMRGVCAYFPTSLVTV
jgi:hypothetical protein